MAEKMKSTALRRLDSPRDDLFAFEIDGHLTSQEIVEVYSALEKAYEKHDKVDVLLRLTNLDGWDWSAAWTETTWIGKTHALRHLRKYAVVGGPPWIRTMITVFDPLFQVEMKGFEANQEEEARAWLG